MRRFAREGICTTVRDLFARQRTRDGFDPSRSLVTESRSDDHLIVSVILKLDEKAMLAWPS